MNREKGFETPFFPQPERKIPILCKGDAIPFSLLKP